MRTKNAGYELIHHVSIADKEFVTGFNPNAPAQFVTWQYFEKGDYFYQGHYFSSQTEATLDMLRRAGNELDLNGKSLGIALLSQEDRQELGIQFREEKEVETIATALDILFEQGTSEYDVDGLMSNSAFMVLARGRCQNIDHTYENEALAEALADVVEKFPEYKIPDIKSQDVALKLSPEMKVLVQEMLSTPTSQLRDKYGPLGDNLEFPLYLGEYKASLELVPAYDYDETELSATNPHRFHLRVFNEKGRSFTPNHISLNSDVTSPASAASLLISFGDADVRLCLEEDESLRRIGNQFMFKAVSEESIYHKHDGEICTVKRALTPKESDVFISGMMWEAEFPGGEVLYIFDRELHSLDKENKEKKVPLDQQIARAHNKNNLPSPGQIPKEPER